MEDTYSNFSGRTTAAAPAEDYRLYDRIWQRVAPELNPYPEVRQAEGAGGTESAALGDTGENLEHLPGAQSDPCCMGSAAMDSLQVLTGFLEDERAGRRTLLQLAAQAMCLEEMFSAQIPQGAIFYGETRRRETVEITEELRQEVRKMFREMHEYYDRRYTPKVKYSKSCNACSLKDICLPRLGKAVSVKSYMNEMLKEEDA